MDPQSPPKRMTRARAAKVGDGNATAKTTKIVTAASKAKTTRSVSTTMTTISASTKRKTRADEVEEDDDNMDELAQPDAPALKTRTRGRPRKVAAEPEPKAAPAPARTTRGRPTKKVVISEPSSKEEPTVPAPKPTARAARTTRKTVTQQQPETAETAPQPEKKLVTRTRATATGATRSTAAKAAATVKKSVTFEEPEKENIAPAEAPKPKRGTAAAAAASGTKAETATTGLRAKPVRRTAVGATVRAAAAGAAGTRGGAAAKKAGTAESNGESKQYEKPTPLSPKKVTQMAMHNRATKTATKTMTKQHQHADYAESEDELALTDEKPFTRPAARLRGQAAKVPAAVSRSVSAEKPTDDEDEATSATTTAAASSTIPELVQQPTTLLASPCRRPPASPWKDSLKTPAKKAEGVVPVLLSQSAIRPPTSSRLEFGEAMAAMTGAQPPAQSTFKTSLLQSPAKRLGGGSPIKASSSSASQQLPGPVAPSPMLFKSSLMASPAKRVQPCFLAGASKDEGIFGRTPVTKPTLLATPLHVGTADAGRKLNEMEGTGIPEEEEGDEDDEEEDSDEEDEMPDSPSRGSRGRAPLFPGRLSAVLPRSADPTLVAAGAVDVAAEEDQEEQEQERVHEPEQEQEAEVHEEDAEHESVPEEEEEEAELDDPELTDTEDEHLKGTQPIPMVDGVSVPGSTAMEQEEEEVVDARHEDRMDLDEDSEAVETDHEEQDMTTTPPDSPPGAAKYVQHGFFDLREKDLKPAYEQDADSDEDDELDSSTLKHGPATPCPAAGARTPSTRLASRGTAKRARMSEKFGFTPLAGQLSGWGDQSSPLKAGVLMPESPGSDILCNQAEATPSSRIPMSASPMKNGFFDEAMAAKAVVTPTQEGKPSSPAMQQVVEADGDAAMTGVLTPEFDEITPTYEDVELAAEANEMSLLEPEQVEEHIQQSNDDSLSEASQEYGDENEIPIDPTLLVPPVTPQRNYQREFHTVTKVPLKPADDSTPRSKPKRRGHSISKLPAARPTHQLHRNATVISYSPDKQAVSDEKEKEKAGQAGEPVTPSKQPEASIWENAITPGRTPRKDLNPVLLRGAVVFVDVHTGEGADASGIFVELLTQMGARCVKSWTWNPSGPASASEDGGAGQSKIGITHVVYKDGGKRTLEKVRETAGVVQCVGVSWVLDCERENQWLDEAPYYIDTSLVPRGGARRRKSMEPRALANLNGQVVATTPSQNGSNANNNTATTPSFASKARNCASAPTTPLPQTSSTRRRDSALWVRTPPETHHHHTHGHGPGSGDDYFNWDKENDHPTYDNNDGDDDDDDDMDNSFLMPVPKTPAPEAVARYAAQVAMDLTPSTTAGDDDEDEDEDEDERRARVMTRTCPPKSTSAYSVLGEGILKREKDEGVLMRLMAARRKSLQFAPKIGSPLARAWIG